MTKHRFRMPVNGSLVDLTSLVMSEGEFAECVRFVFDGPPIIRVEGGGRTDPGHAKAFLEAKHIPMIARGTVTQRVFDQYAVETDYMSVIVRGQGEALAAKLLAGS